MTAFINPNAPVANANDAVTEGETALMTAARSGHVDAVKLLIARGAVVDAREHWRGQTALMWAAAEAHSDVVQTLVGLAADVNTASVDWNSIQLDINTGALQELALALQSSGGGDGGGGSGGLISSSYYPSSRVNREIVRPSCVTGSKNISSGRTHQPLSLYSGR